MHSLIDFLRVISLAMIFLFVGLNIAIWKHHYEDRNRLVYIGRFGIATALIMLISPKLINYTFPASYFYLVLVPSLLCYSIGLLRFYKKKSIQEEEHETSTEEKR